MAHYVPAAGFRRRLSARAAAPVISVLRPARAISAEATRQRCLPCATVQDVANRLGPMPEATLRCLIDLGLNNGEIARYVGVDVGAVLRLRREFGLGLGTLELPDGAGSGDVRVAM